MPAPEGGYGPVNYSQPGGSSPFSGFDNRIKYNDYVRYQAISQYQQNTIQPATMTLSQQRRIASDPAFQYGVSGGQDPRFFQRQSRLNSMAYGSAVTRGMMDIGSYQLGATGVAAMGLGGVSGFVAPIAATMAGMHFVNKGIQNNLMRQRYMHSIAGDIEQNSGRLGFNKPLGYNEATQLGSSIYARMESPGQFFSKEQQVRIHKIGLSNNLLTSKSKGINSGTTQQYKENVKELTETTEEVVKLLQTTLEGGMSVIKELQQKGFGSMRQIKQQVLQAKAIGGVTGMGSQNIMALGAQGAQAVQGTPWAANVGANMYQYGAAQANMIAQSGPAGSYAVQRMGGVAQAGGALGRATMNMMSSGIGTRVAAYAMNPDGTINEGRLDNLTGGNVSAYDIVSRSNQVGYAMGGSRVRFDMFKEDMMNKIGNDPAKMNSMMRAGFSAWEQQRPYDKLKDKAWVFSGMYTNNSREKRLLYESLLGVPNFGRVRAAGAVASAAANPATLEREMGSFGRFTSSIGRGFANTFTDIGESIGYGSTAILEGSANIFNKAGEGLGIAAENVLKSVGIMGEYGGKNRANYGNYKAGLENLYGLGAQSTAAGSAALSRLSAGDIQSMFRKPKAHAGTANWLSRASADEIKYVTQAAISGGDLLSDPKFRQAIGGDQSIMSLAKGGGLLATLAAEKSKFGKSARAEFEQAIGNYDTWFKGLSKEEQDNSRRRVQVEMAAVKSGNYETLTGKSYRDMTAYRDKYDLKDRLKGPEVVMLDVADRKYKAEDMGATVPAGTAMVSSLKEIAKQTEKTIKDIVSPTDTVEYQPIYGTTLPRTYYTKEARQTKRMAKRAGINVNEKGWQRNFVNTLRAAKDDPKSYPDIAGDTDLMFYAQDKLGAVNKAIDREAGAREYQSRIGYVRSHLMALPPGLRDTEFANTLTSNAILPAGAGGMSEDKWGSFKTSNADRFQAMGFYKSDLRNLTREMFMGKILNNMSSATVIPNDVHTQKQIAKDMEAIYQGMKHNTKQVTVNSLNEDVDASDDKTAELALDRLREKRENLKTIREYEQNETARGRGIETTVRPPVLNYWNNAWMV